MPKDQDKSQKKADKMVKPKQAVRPFNFPNHNLTVEAANIREAEAKLESHLKSKSKQDD